MEIVAWVDWISLFLWINWKRSISFVWIYWWGKIYFVTKQGHVNPILVEQLGQHSPQIEKLLGQQNPYFVKCLGCWQTINGKLIGHIYPKMCLVALFQFYPEIRNPKFFLCSKTWTSNVEASEGFLRCK